MTHVCPDMCAVSLQFHENSAIFLRFFLGNAAPMMVVSSLMLLRSHKIDILKYFSTHTSTK